MKRFSLFLYSIFLIASFLSCDSQERQPLRQQAGQTQALGRRAPGSILSVEETAHYTFYVFENGALELPITGATGWASIELPLYDGARETANTIAVLDAGQAFTVLEERGDWWLVEMDNRSGWVTSALCMINLPDILPSIVYNITNATESLFRSSGQYIPNVTGEVLYEARDFNARLGREEYIAPVLYGMARKIGAAQRTALAEGNTLVIFEAFRPSSAHDVVYENLHALALADPVVWAGMSTPPWNTRWFLAAAPYNHQRGTAIDVSLARVDHYQIKATGDYAFIHISGYTPHPMQTPMHELSIAAVVFQEPVHARSLTAWKDGVFSDKATPATVLMQRYLTEAGLIPLASEWWHFNDLVNTAIAVDHGITGEFSTESTVSRPPQQMPIAR